MMCGPYNEHSYICQEARSKRYRSVGSGGYLTLTMLKPPGQSELPLLWLIWHLTAANLPVEGQKIEDLTSQVALASLNYPPNLQWL